MNTQKKVFLLPYHFQVADRIVAIIGLPAWMAAFIMTAIHIDMDSSQMIHWHLYSVLILVVGLYLIGFSREKQEDEFTLHLRTSSALSALLVISGLKIVLTFLVAFLQMKDIIAKDCIVEDLTKGWTSLSAVFFLYLIIYKIRLRRFNKEMNAQID